jgi:hypothetical protein
MLAAIVGAAYLVAAFVPCEPVLVFVDWTKADTSHAAASSSAVQVAVPASAPSRSTSGASRAAHAPPQHSSHGSAHGSTSSVALAEPAGHEHGSHHAPAASSAEPVGERTDRIAQSHAERGGCELELKPTCRCGCSESRATVGGSVSRLGAAVPAVHVARLLEARSLEVCDRVLARACSPDPDREPIPI